MKKSFSFSVVKIILLGMCAFLLGGAGDFVMAAATALPESGVQEAGDGDPNDPLDPTGVSTQSFAKGEHTDENGDPLNDPEFISKEVDEAILMIDPISTPIDTISRQCKKVNVKSLTVKYYSMGTRPNTTKLTQAVSAMGESDTTAKLYVEDVNVFSKHDTIRVVGVKAKYDHKLKAYNPNSKSTPDLVLKVLKIDDTDGTVVVHAVNGNINENVEGGSILIPQQLNIGQDLVRMGKACSEMDSQTGRYNMLPNSETQFLQTFMIQVEMSKLMKAVKKEVKFTFNDLEEASVRDMKRSMESTYLFGDAHVINHPIDGCETYYTGGIYWMAGRDIDLEMEEDGSVKATTLVDAQMESFKGEGAGSRRKLLVGGRNITGALAKIESDKIRYTQDVKDYHLEFDSFRSTFGKWDAIYSEFFDYNLMPNEALAIDPRYMTKYVFLNWSRDILELDKSGQRNTDAVRIKQISGIVLRNKQAHSRIHLVESTAHA